MSTFIAIVLVCLLSMVSGLYVRDAQNDHLSVTPVGKKFHYTLAGIMFTFSVGMGVLVCSIPN